MVGGRLGANAADSTLTRPAAPPAVGDPDEWLLPRTYFPQVLAQGRSR